VKSGRLVSFTNERKFVHGLCLRVVGAASLVVLLAPLRLVGVDLPYEIPRGNISGV
jgi:hypothetical protein